MPLSLAETGSFLNRRLPLRHLFPDGTDNSCSLVYLRFHVTYLARDHDRDGTPPLCTCSLLAIKIFFSRENELKVFKLLGELGFGPALLATLEDGRVEEFLEGKVS